MNQPSANPADVFWIPCPTAGSLGIVRRPRGGDWIDAEIARMKASRVDLVVSLLTNDELEDLDLSSEASNCLAQGIDFIPAPVPDLGAPQDDDAFEAALRRVLDALADGRSAAIHCRQSVGRSGLMACAVLIALGASVDDSVAIVSGARGVAVPETAAQRAWLRAFADRTVL